MQGYIVLIMQSWDSVQVEIADLNLFRKNRVSGLFASISIETEDMAIFQKLKDNGIPTVFIDRVPEETGFIKVCQP